MPDLGHHITKHVPMPIVRSLTALGFLGLFFVIASIVRPVASTATLSPTGSQTAQAAAPAYIGSLEGPVYRVEVFITPEGTRYTVVAGDESVLAKLIDADELAYGFPELDFQGMHADSEEREDNSLEP